MIDENRLEIFDATLKVVYISSGDFPLRNGIEAGTLDANFFTWGTGGQVLVATVFPYL